MAEKLDYNEAIDELESIVNEIETGEISVDVLSEKIKRASFLIEYCKKKLTSTEKEVEKLLEGLE